MNDPTVTLDSGPGPGASEPDSEADSESRSHHWHGSLVEHRDHQILIREQSDLKILQLPTFAGDQVRPRDALTPGPFQVPSHED